MALVDITSTLEGAATVAGAADAQRSAASTHQGSAVVVAEVTAVHPSDAALQASSDIALELDRVRDASVQIAGKAAFSGEGNLGAGSDIELTGTSSVAVAATLNHGATSTIRGNSWLGASANHALVAVSAAMAGSASLQGDGTTLGAFGHDSYGGSPYGGERPAFGVESALALSPTQVRVRYTAMLDIGFPLLLAPNNYSISPSVTIHSIVLESAQTVLLNTSTLVAVVYEVTVLGAEGYWGERLDPALNTAQFLGVEAPPTFYAVATRKNRVRVVFSEVIAPKASLTNAAQYVVTDFSGTPIAVQSVVPEQVAGLRSLVLELAQDLADERHYRVTLLGGAVFPDTSAFQWSENPQQTQIPVGQFSGETTGGLYGIHGGLVFFSPALESPAANSIIQVEDVSVCTRAYDEYHLPQPVSRTASLTTHGAGIVPTPVTTLNSTDVLWASNPRLVEAPRFRLITVEPIAPPVDGPCTSILTETWPFDKVAILNNATWRLFDSLGTPPEYFITADNLAPFPKGSTIRILG